MKVGEEIGGEEINDYEKEEGDLEAVDEVEGRERDRGGAAWESYEQEVYKATFSFYFSPA